MDRRARQALACTVDPAVCWDTLRPPHTRSTYAGPRMQQEAQEASLGGRALQMRASPREAKVQPGCSGACCSSNGSCAHGQLP